MVSLLRSVHRVTILRLPPSNCRGFFYGWFVNVFNKVDTNRIAEVGPDRAAAEWLLRCGASVRWKGAGRPLKDYNALPAGDYRRYRIEEVDATDSAVMESGFPHFQDLTEFKKLKLVNCTYLTDVSLKYLVMMTKNQLQHLEVESNGAITDDGVVYLRKLESLRYLRLYDLPGVECPEEVIRRIATDLPSCTLEFPPYKLPDKETPRTPDSQEKS